MVLLTEQATKWSKRLHLQEESVFNPSEEAVNQPKTKKSRAAYEAMISVIQKQMCGQPLRIATDAADEILSVLNNENLRNPEKKKEIENIVYPINNTTFDQLVSNGRLITDYQDEGDGAAEGALVNEDGALDDDVDVAVDMFKENEEEEEDEESGLDIIQDDEDGLAVTVDVFKENEEEEDHESDLDINPDDVAEPNASIAMQMGDGIDDDDMPEGNDGLTLNVQEIDAYWVQRKISQAYDQQIDPQQSQKLAEEVLRILAEGDDRELETNVLVHLQFDKFSLIKFLHNRLKIVWCTRLARAEDQDERKKIEEEMMNHGPDLAAILDQLHATWATVNQRQKNLAKSIDDGNRARVGLVDHDADNGWLRGQRQLLDLESLVFQQGSLLMANNKVVLPDGSEKRSSMGYVEVCVPPPEPKPLCSDEKIVSIDYR